MLVIVTALVIGAIGGGANALLNHASTSAPGSGRSASSGGTASTISLDSDLRNYLIAAPRGSQSWPKPLGTNRTLSLSQTAGLSTNSTARRTTLIDDHFIRGAVQCWIQSGTWLDVRLYQFGSAAHAQNFFRSDTAASSRSTPARDQSRVSSVPGARAFVNPKPNSGGYISVLVLGVKGNVVFLVDVAEHSSSPHLSLPDSLMQEQYRKL